MGELPSQDEWLKELRDLETAQPDGFTSHEIGAAWGLGPSATMKRLQGLVRSGRMQFAGNRRVLRIDGRPGTQPVYRVVPEAQKE